MIRDPSTMDRPVARRRGRLPFSRATLVALAIVAALAVVALPTVRRWASSDRVVDASRVRTAVVTRGDLVRQVDVQGNVVAAFRPTLTSPARGTAQIEVRAGDAVSRGDVLVRVTSPELGSRLAQERSALAAAAADLERQRLAASQARLRSDQELRLLEVRLDAAERAMDRANRTREMGLTNEVEHERAVDELEIARVQLALARQEAALEQEALAFETRDRAARLERQRLAVAELERQVEELAVRSPVDGVVARLEVADRDSVSSGQPLVSVVDLSRLEIEIMVPEAYAPEIAPGTPAVIDFDGREWAGSVKTIAPEVQGSRVRGVVALDGEAPEGLKQGQRVTTRVLLETRPDVLKVARGPFVEATGGREAYVLEDGVAVARPIELGSLSVAEVEISAGLEEGDTIVISDTSRFEGARRVRLRD